MEYEKIFINIENDSIVKKETIDIEKLSPEVQLQHKIIDLLDNKEYSKIINVFLEENICSEEVIDFALSMLGITENTFNNLWMYRYGYTLV